ncbi:MAG: pyruvate dehydrogenase complex dihydrolipoamide acetyltransferase [Alphaproteobacteria bacterium]|nr:pyruvate dehydrogenase complex dihydrolipoamide acetyltransferase [Alphaproteobacteria bacterium]
MPITILMPALSPTMTEGNLARWLKAEGDSVVPGDVIAEIETDKATMEVESVDEGVLGKILVAEGTEEIAVNTPIAVILEDGEDSSALASFDAGAASPAPAPVAAAAPEPAPEPTPAPAAAAVAAPTPAPQPAPAAPQSSGERVFASPLARRMAEQQGIDLSTVGGTGPNGRIVKADIEAYAGGTAPAVAATPSATPTAPIAGETPYDLVPVNNIRKVVARRLTESKQSVPHFYMTVDCEIDALLGVRADLNGRAKDGEFKISVNDMIIKACGVALMQVPAANASWSDDGIKMYKQADISVAVAIDDGLITPIVRNANGKGLRAISEDMLDLAGKAREGRLAPEEYQGGTFSISNLGMFGIKDFQAVINPPQGCILAIGAGEQRPIVKEGALAVATMMSVTLSCDHRVVDGAVGAEFLAAFKTLIEDPLGMLL